MPFQTQNALASSHEMLPDRLLGRTERGVGAEVVDLRALDVVRAARSRVDARLVGAVGDLGLVEPVGSYEHLVSGMFVSLPPLVGTHGERACGYQNHLGRGRDRRLLGDASVDTLVDCDCGRGVEGRADGRRDACRSRSAGSG